MVSSTQDSVLINAGRAWRARDLAGQQCTEPGDLILFGTREPDPVLGVIEHERRTNLWPDTQQSQHSPIGKILTTPLLFWPLENFYFWLLHISIVAQNSTLRRTL